MLNIVADENIPYISQACENMGNIQIMAGRKMCAQSVKKADCLFVRSVTKVNKSLLEGSKVKFVGTATIRFDHIDPKYLSENEIEFTSAPGSNANSVAQYITSAILNLAKKYNLDLNKTTLGIVGVGNVGRLVKKKAESLGMKIILNDPPREMSEGSDEFSPLKELLENSDIVTSHVPLEKEGQFPTFKMADKNFFNQMKDGAFYINSSRGDVCDESSLSEALDNGKIADAVLDVWENEPCINTKLFEKIFIGTPHIAGYSFDGKVNGTEMIVNRARKFFGIEKMWDPKPLLPEPEIPEVSLDGSSSISANIEKAVFEVYNIMDDNMRMRKLLELPKEEIKSAFDKLRKEYPRRREFFNTTVKISNCTKELESTIAGLGFKVEKI